MKAPSDSNSKPIKQLLSGKNEKESLWNSSYSFFQSASTVCPCSLSQAPCQVSFSCDTVDKKPRAPGYIHQQEGITYSPRASSSSSFLHRYRTWLTEIYIEWQVNRFIRTYLLASISNHIFGRKLPPTVLMPKAPWNHKNPFLDYLTRRLVLDNFYMYMMNRTEKQNQWSEVKLSSSIV